MLIFPGHKIHFERNSGRRRFAHNMLRICMLIKGNPIAWPETCIFHYVYRISITRVPFDKIVIQYACKSAYKSDWHLVSFPFTECLNIYVRRSARKQNANWQNKMDIGLYRTCPVSTRIHKIIESTHRDERIISTAKHVQCKPTRNYMDPERNEDFRVKVVRNERPSSHWRQTARY